jgi:hypothetical protein
MLNIWLVYGWYMVGISLVLGWYMVGPYPAWGMKVSGFVYKLFFGG